VKLKNVIGKNCFKIDADVYNDNFLAEMSVEELKVLKSRVDGKVRSIAAQLQAKKIDYQSGGAGASRKWYLDHKYTLGMFQKILPALNDYIKKRNREERSVSDYFVDEARNFLDKNTFDAIMENARREKELLTGIKKTE
jgi:hypothetical protein